MKRKKLPIPTLKNLLARSGGFCENPECNCDLFIFFKNKTFVDINEAAHIIALSPKGPRAYEGNRHGLDEPGNILLLCPKCHQIIDKAPEHFPSEVLYLWKTEHENKIRKLFNNERVSSRDELISRIGTILVENNIIFETFGPSKEKEGIILSDQTELWHRNVIDTIIPNNRKLLVILQENTHLLSNEEQKGLVEFKLHKESFELSHLTDMRNSSVPVFPRYFFENLTRG